MRISVFFLFLALGTDTGKAIGALGGTVGGAIGALQSDSRNFAAAFGGGIGGKNLKYVLN